MMHSEKTNSSHIVHLDGFRGMSIILVMVSHFFSFSTKVAIGWSGVDSFFVLSGFLITGILLDTKKSENYFKNFYLKRILRIFPLYYFVLFLLFAVYPLFKSDLIKNYAYFQQNQMWFWTYLQNWFYAFKGWPPTNLLMHFWSLAIEEQYYIFWPLVVFLVSDKKLLLITGFLFLLSPIIRYIHPDLPFAYVNTFCRLEGLAFGSAIAIAQKVFNFNYKKYALVFYSGMILIAGYFYMQYDMNFYRSYCVRFGYTLSALFYGFLLISTFIDNKLGLVLKRIFSTGFLTFTGKISYGLYVYHLVIYTIFFDYITARFNTIIKTNLLLKVLVGVFFMVLSYLISYISFNLLEKNITNLKYKLIRQ